MARIPTELILSLIDLGIAAFSKKRKVRKVLELIGESAERAEAFKAARDKIDAAEAAGSTCTLSIDEVEALDYVMDQFAGVARRLKRSIS